MKLNNIKIGVLGGIGPESTSYFYAHLIEKFQKEFKPKDNTYFPNIIINSIPAPEIIDSKEISRSDLNNYYHGIKDLNKLQPDFIVMVCNTIHFFYEDIQKISKSRVLNLSELLSKKIKSHKADKICVLGTFSSVKNNIYKISEEKLLNLSDKDNSQVIELIRNYNKGLDKEKQIKIFNKLLNKILKQKNILVMLGCTELSLMNRSKSENVLSSLDLMVGELLRELKRINKS